MRGLDPRIRQERGYWRMVGRISLPACSIFSPNSRARANRLDGLSASTNFPIGPCGGVAGSAFAPPPPPAPAGARPPGGRGGLGGGGVGGGLGFGGAGLALLLFLLR